MKKHLITIFWLIVFTSVTYLGYKLGVTFLSDLTPEKAKMLYKLLSYTFVSGMALSAIIFRFSSISASNSLNMYKRELEKESIDKVEHSSRVKVLESKIQVLEKALDEALKK